MRTQMPKYARPHTSILYRRCVKCFWQHVTVMNTYSCMDAVIILYINMVSNCCLSLYLNIAGLWQGRGKCVWNPGKVPEFFYEQASVNCVVDSLCRTEWHFVYWQHYSMYRYICHSTALVFIILYFCVRFLSVKIILFNSPSCSYVNLERGCQRARKLKKEDAMDRSR